MTRIPFTPLGVHSMKYFKVNLFLSLCLWNIQYYQSPIDNPRTKISHIAYILFKKKIAVGVKSGFVTCNQMIDNVLHGYRF